MNDRQDQIAEMIAGVGVMLAAHATLPADLPPRERLEEMFRATLLAAHILNIVGPMLIVVGDAMGLTPEDFDSLALDVATQGAAENLSPDDFA